MAQNYFRYIPAAAEAQPWGIAVTAAGFTRIPPGSDYPPAGHPSDHHFSWAKGRVLGTFQLVFILEGSGVFESRSRGSVAIGGGTAFLLFPKEWHRFMPNRATGWVESWLELDGDAVRRLLRARILTPEQPVHVLRQRARLESLFEQVHVRLRDAGPGFDPEPGAAALSILAQLRAEQRTLAAAPSPLEHAVTRAQTLLAEPDRKALSVPALARTLGVGYSHFRREFKRCVGLSPKQYYDRIRLERGRRLLGGTALNLEEIAQRLGYISGFHFSAAFKREFGVAPAHWRKTHLRG